jgi:hypothetical protein
MFGGGNATSELLRICAYAEDDRHDVVAMTLNFASALAHRKRFRKFSKLIRDHGSDFVVEEESQELFQVKKNTEHTDRVADNVRRCLEVLRLNNRVISTILSWKRESFDVFNPTHMELLNNFWQCMKPDKERSNSTGFISVDWIELGFQNADPTTDFRGMGILGLMQLAYFSEHRTQRARFIHAALSSPKKYYPFAIIGINITSFVIEMILECRLQRALLENLSHTVAGDIKRYEIMPSEDPICVDFGVNVVHDTYCLIFEEFYLQWVIINPESIMSFGEIFDEVKKSIRKKFSGL